MKKFIIKAILFVIILGIVDIAIGYIGGVMVMALGEQNRGGKAAMTCHNIVSAEPDVAIIGSSPALTAYIPHIIKDSIKCYTGSDYKVRNASCFVQGMPYFWAETKILTSRKKTKIIILDLVPQTLSDFKDNVNILFPYYHYDDEIKEMIDSKVDSYEKVKLQSKAYCLNTSIADFMYGIIRGENAEGYWAEYGKLSEFKHEHIASSKIDSINLSLFKNIINFTKANGIKLIIVTSPSSIYYDNSCETRTTLAELCENDGIQYLDYTGNLIFEDPSLFTDESHLNDDGARIFSSHISHELKGEFITSLRN